MDRMIYLSMAGAKATMQRQDALAHNLANASTPGFRAEMTAFRAVPVRGLAHITGGGLTDNIPRVVPAELEVVIERRRWHRDPVFDWLQRAGNIASAEMYRTFNCGIGMVVIVAPDRTEESLRLLTAAGETATVIGEVRRGARGVVIQE